MTRVRTFPLAVGLFVLGVTFSTPATAGVINTFDSTGDVTTSSTQAPGTWYTDRYAPAAFSAGQTGGGRTGVLALGISSADGQNNRPGSFSSAFYNTQGRKFDLAPGTTSLFVDMYVPASGFDGAGQRYAGLWGTAVNVADAISAYPIIEFAEGGFRTWNGASWDVVGPAAGDQWYEVGLALNGSNFDYFINGQQVGSFGGNGSVGLANVILQGHNTTDGVNYTAYFDNLSTTSAIPEPATLAVFGVMAAAGLGVRFRRRKVAQTV